MACWNQRGVQFYWKTPTSSSLHQYNLLHTFHRFTLAGLTPFKLGPIYALRSPNQKQNRRALRAIYKCCHKDPLPVYHKKRILRLESSIDEGPDFLSALKDAIKFRFMIILLPLSGSCAANFAAKVGRNSKSSFCDGGGAEGNQATTSWRDLEMVWSKGSSHAGGPSLSIRNHIWIILNLFILFFARSFVMSHIVVICCVRGSTLSDRVHRHTDIAIHIPFKPSPGCQTGRGHWDCDCTPRGRGLKGKGNPGHLRCARILFDNQVICIHMRHRWDPKHLRPELCHGAVGVQRGPDWRSLVWGCNSGAPSWTNLIWTLS